MRDIELPLQRRFDADLDIVEVDEDRDLEVLVHVHLPYCELLRSFLVSTPARSYAAAWRTIETIALKRSARLENGRHALLFQRSRIFVRNDAADNNLHVGHILLTQQFHHPRHDRVMAPGEDRKPDNLHIFLQGGIDNHFRGLSQTSINDFHARVAQGPRNDLGAAVMAVESRLGNQHPNRMDSSVASCRDTARRLNIDASV